MLYQNSIFHILGAILVVGGATAMTLGIATGNRVQVVSGGGVMVAALTVWAVVMVLFSG